MKISDPGLALDGALDGLSSVHLWRRHLRRRWPTYFIGVLALTATNITEVFMPKLIQWILDALSTSVQRIEIYIGWLVALLTMQFVARVIWRQTLAQQTHRVSSKLKSIVWDRARYFPRRRLETDLSPGELMNIATGDVGTARYIFGFTIVGTVDFIALLLFTLIAMLTIDWQLTLCALIVMPLLPILLDRIARRESQQHHLAQESLSHLTDLAAQSVSTIRLQRLSRSENFWQRKLNYAAEDYRTKRFRVVKTSLAFIPITGLAPLISYGILIALGVQKVFSGQMTFGAFVAMQSYIFLIESPLLELGTIVSEWQRSFASLDRVTRTLGQAETPQLRQGGLAQVPAADLVYELRHIRFSYNPEGRPILQNFDLRIQKGERLGISGPIGSGKSTLLGILAGLENNFTGEVRFHDTPIQNFSHLALREKIAFVPQKSFLFADTIRANLLLHREFSDAALWNFLELAGLRADIEQFPQGLDTKLGEWGVNLSGGQKQRLTLARALLGKPEVLLLDDCLSAVDTLTEEKILQNLNRYLQGSTLIWVAHRDSTLRDCDRILHLGGENA